MAAIACDPELFLVEKHTGNAVSAIGLIGGSKNEPLPVKFGGLQEDNVAVEFNIDPVKTKKKFIKSITSILAEIGNRVEGKGLLPVIASSMEFPAAELGHPLAQEAGCDPDYNVWTGQENPIPELPNTNVRSAGGHIHIDLPEYFENEEMELAVKAADLLIGVPLTAQHFDGVRRNLYGKAGAYRPKHYGFEYRTPDNFWLSSEELMGFVFDAAQRVHKEYDKWGPLADKYKAQIDAAINFGDPDAARILLALIME